MEERGGNDGNAVVDKLFCVDMTSVDITSIAALDGGASRGEVKLLEGMEE